MSTSLTIEEAVALMVNMDFIPDGETVLSMTAAFLEDATAEYENASSHDQYQLKVLENRMEACEARHSLAQFLTKALTEDAIYTDDTLIECDDASTDKNPLVTLDSLSAWAYDRFGIAIPRKDVATLNVPIATSNAKIPSWEQVRIKIHADCMDVEIYTDGKADNIYTNYRIAFSLDNGVWRSSTFLAIDLVDKRKLLPNMTGGILVKLSQRKKYPEGAQLSPANKTAITKLRRSLEKLTGLTDDAFLPFNNADGYKPRFELEDDRKNADDRAKRKAVHICIDKLTYENDELQFEHENDAASKWMAEENAK